MLASASPGLLNCSFWKAEMHWHEVRFKTMPVLAFELWDRAKHRLLGGTG